ncbi:type IV pilin protein [Dokdonella sp.]|uniref:type IV pilin protein n=1 Tax=Dokdonella sp. TaxID=2291710 RepID=UPI003AF85497
MHRNRSKAFTLIEMMIVVAIVAIIAAVAYPSYANYAFRARRVDGQEFLMRLAAAQERYYTNLNQYATMAQLGLGTTSEKGHYTGSVALANSNQTYTLTATATGVQAADKCGNLTLTNTGAKDQTGDETNGKCW